MLEKGTAIGPKQFLGFLINIIWDAKNTARVEKQYCSNVENPGTYSSALTIGE